MANLRKRAILIFAIALLAAITMAFFRSRAPRQYEAVVTFLVSASKLDANSGAVAVATANLVPVLQNPVVVQEALTAVGVSTTTSPISAATFLRDSLRVNPLGGTALVELRVRLDSADLAARTANAIAERSVALDHRLNDAAATTARDQLETQVAAAKTLYTTRATALESLKRSAMVDLLRKDAESILKEQSALRQLEGDVAAARASVARTEQELTKHPRIDVLTRAIDADPALLEAARAAAGGRALELKLRAEEINQVHETLDADLAAQRGRLAGMEDHLTRARTAVGPAGQATLAHLYQLEREVAAAEIEMQISQKAYEQAANQYETARLQISSRIETLQVVSPAVPPEQPLSRQIVINAIMAFALAGGAAMFLVLALDAGAPGLRRRGV